jgi:hypothetical protein
MGSPEKTPTVGMGATVVMWTDRKAATVIEVSPSGKTFKIQIDKSTRTDGHGMSDSQDYSYEADPEGSIYTVRMSKRGWNAHGIGRVSLGQRDTYHDFSF